MGYHRAGFDVVGVDIEPQPNYPFEFHQADALTFDLRGYDAVHASPPCQLFTRLGNHTAAARAARHKNLIWPTRFRLQSTGVPYVIENLPGAPLDQPYLLCGAAMGLEVVRHRMFESSVFLMVPSCGHTQGGTKSGQYVGFRRGRHPDGWRPPRAGEAQWRDACGVPWMTTREARQVIPPAYTELIGAQLLDLVGAVA